MNFFGWRYLASKGFYKKIKTPFRIVLCTILFLQFALSLIVLFQLITNAFDDGIEILFMSIAASFIVELFFEMVYFYAFVKSKPHMEDFRKQREMPKEEQYFPDEQQHEYFDKWE